MRPSQTVVLYLCTVMKNFLHRSTAMLLAFLVVLSTLSFTIEKHFCGDNLIDVSLFANAKKCGMEALEIEMAKLTKKNCCKDVVNVFQGQKELKSSNFDDLTFQQQVFLQAYVISYIDLFKNLPEQVVPFKEYSPPKIVKDIHLLDEVYLI